MIAEGGQCASQTPPDCRVVSSQRDRPTIRVVRLREMALAMVSVGEPAEQRGGIRGARHGLLEQFDRLPRASQGLEDIGQAAEGGDIVRLGQQGLPVARGRVLQPPRAVMLAGPLEPFPPVLAHSVPSLVPGDHREAPTGATHPPNPTAVSVSGGWGRGNDGGSGHSDEPMRPGHEAHAGLALPGFPSRHGSSGESAGQRNP